MTWTDDLRQWLINGPRPHEPPGQSRSCYGWLKAHGPEILAATAKVATRPNQCAVSNTHGRCPETAVVQIRTRHARRVVWTKRCAAHTPHGAETRPL